MVVITCGELLIDFVSTEAGVSLAQAPAFKKALSFCFHVHSTWKLFTSAMKGSETIPPKRVQHKAEVLLAKLPTRLRSLKVI